MRRWNAVLGEESGANLVEYSLLIAFIVLVAVLAVTFLGGETTSKIAEVGSGL